VGVAVATWVLTVPPLSTVAVTGSVTVDGSCSFSCPATHSRQAANLPANTSDHVRWSEENHFAVTFEVVGPSYPSIVCYWNAPSGSCDFTSVGGNYTFLLLPPDHPSQLSYAVTFTVTYGEPFV